MRTTIRNLALRSGLLTADRILAPVTRIVADLDALIEHRHDQVSETMARSINLSQQARALAEQAREFNDETAGVIAQRNRVAQLLGQ